MVILAVNQSDPDGIVCQLESRVQASEARANDHNFRNVFAVHPILVEEQCLRRLPGLGVRGYGRIGYSNETSCITL